MSTQRFQVSLIPPSRAVWETFEHLARVLESDTHFPRLQDYPMPGDERSSADIARMLLCKNIPFSIVGVFGDEPEMERAWEIFCLLRKRTPSVLILCKDGYRHVRKKIDIPYFATGNPPYTHTLHASILVGNKADFGGYDEALLGTPILIAAADWQVGNFTALADEVRKFAKPAKYQIPL